MLVYLSTYLLLFSVGFIDSINQSRKNNVFFLLVLLLICHDGLRWETGTDWDDYYKAFELCLSQPFDYWEVGYTFVMELIRSITDRYTIFLIFHAIFVYVLIATIFWKYSPIPTLSLFFFYGAMLPVLGMNRQYMALAICFLSIIFIIRRKLLFFLLCVFVAFLFHKSALIFIPAYFLTKSYSSKVYLLWIIVAILISFSGIIKLIPSNFILLLYPEDYGSYVEYVDISFLSKILGIIRKLMWVAFVFFIIKRQKRPNNFSLFFNLYFVSVIGYLLLNGTLFQIIVARGFIFYTVFEVFVLTYLISTLSDMRNKKIYLILIALYYTFLLYKNITYYTDDGYNCFIPYRNVFM